VTASIPGDEQVIEAVPFAVSTSSDAARVTVWFVDQLLVVNVRLAPPVTVRFTSPADHATATTTSLVGWDESLTWNVFVPPSGTITDDALVMILVPVVVFTLA
jgi:hypothetical protein